MVTRLRLVALLGLAACEVQPAGVEPPPAPPPGPGSESFAITPANPGLTTGTSIQFEARSTGGAPLPVRWEADNTVSSSISQTGLFTAGCGTGTARIRAVLLADTTRSATTRITITELAYARVQISNITDAATHAAAILDSIANPVETSVQIEGSPCFQVASVRLDLNSGAGGVSVSRTDFATPLTSKTTQALQWNPGGYPNGAYNLSAVLTLVAGGTLSSNAIPIQIRHP